MILWENFTNPSSKKNLPHSQNPKCSWIIIRWSFTMFVYYINLKSKMLARTGVKIVNTNVHCMPSFNLGTGFTRECIRFRESFAQCRATQQSSTDYLQVKLYTGGSWSSCCVGRSCISWQLIPVPDGLGEERLTEGLTTRSFLIKAIFASSPAVVGLDILVVVYIN